MIGLAIVVTGLLTVKSGIVFHLPPSGRRNQCARRHSSFVAPEQRIDCEVPTFAVIMRIIVGQITRYSTQVIIQEVVDSREGYRFVAHEVTVTSTHESRLRTTDSTGISLTGICIFNRVHYIPVVYSTHYSARGSFLIPDFVYASLRFVVVKQRIPHMDVVVVGYSAACRPWNKVQVIFRNRTDSKVLRIVTTEAVECTVGINATTVSRHIVLNEARCEHERNVSFGDTQHFRQIIVIIKSGIPVAFDQNTASAEICHHLGISCDIGLVNLVGIPAGNGHTVNQDNSGVAALLRFRFQVSQ